jgi:putative phosphoribosyl transferase
MLDYSLIQSLHISSDQVSRLIAKEEKEIERREQMFRDGLPAQVLSGRMVILVDDGAATGSTMLAAAEAVRRQNPKEILIALPVASREAYRIFVSEVGKCICLAIPEPFYAVGQWYQSFTQVSDEEVQSLLSQTRFQKAAIE